MKETHKKQGTKHRTNRGREVFRKKIGRKLSLSKKKNKQGKILSKKQERKFSKRRKFLYKRGKKH